MRNSAISEELKFHLALYQKGERCSWEQSCAAERMAESWTKLRCLIQARVPKHLTREPFHSGWLYLILQNRSTQKIWKSS